jgi:hypothetical protein
MNPEFTTLRSNSKTGDIPERNDPSVGLKMTESALSDGKTRSTSNRKSSKMRFSQRNDETRHTEVSKNKSCHRKSFQKSEKDALISKIKVAIESISSFNGATRQIMVNRFLEYIESPTMNSKNKLFEDLRQLLQAQEIPKNDNITLNAHIQSEELFKRIKGYIKDSQRTYNLAKMMRMEAENQKIESKKLRYDTFLAHLNDLRSHMKKSVEDDKIKLKRTDVDIQSANKNHLASRRCNSVCHRYRSLQKNSPSVLAKMVDNYKKDPCFVKQNRSVSYKKYESKWKSQDQGLVEDEVHSTAPFLEHTAIHRINTRMNKKVYASNDDPSRLQKDKFTPHYNFDRQKPMYLHDKMQKMEQIGNLSGPALSKHFLKKKIEAEQIKDKETQAELEKAKSMEKKPVSEAFKLFVKGNFKKIIEEKKVQEENKKVERFEKEVMLKFIDFQAKEHLQKCRKRKFMPQHDFNISSENPQNMMDDNFDFKQSKTTKFTNKCNVDDNVGKVVSRPKSAQSKVRTFKYTWKDVPKVHKNISAKKKRSRSTPIVRKEIERITMMNIPLESKENRNQEVVPKTKKAKRIKGENFHSEVKTQKAKASFKSTIDQKSKLASSTVRVGVKFNSDKPEAFIKTKNNSTRVKNTPLKKTIVKVNPEVHKSTRDVIENFLDDLPQDEGMERTSTNVTLISMDQLFTMSADKLLKIPYLKVI